MKILGIIREYKFIIINVCKVWERFELMFISCILLCDMKLFVYKYFLVWSWILVVYLSVCVINIFS